MIVKKQKEERYNKSIRYRRYNQVHKSNKGEKWMKTNEQELIWLKRAEEIATIAHAGLFDKGGTPYIEHPRRVAARMDTAARKIVAWLHDVVEDTTWSLKDLKKEGFPNEIIKAVDAITRRDGERNADYYYRLSQDDLASYVKAYGDHPENMDLTRIPNHTEKDKKRVAHYQKMNAILKGAGTEYFFTNTPNGLNWVHVSKIQKRNKD